MNDFQPTTYGERNSAVAVAIAKVWEEAKGRPDTAETWEQFMHDAARDACAAADQYDHNEH